MQLIPVHLMKKFLILICLSACCIAASAQRMMVSIDEGWRFHKALATVTEDTEGWEKVSLPHTWNAVDGQHDGHNRLDDNGQAQATTTQVSDPATKFGYYRGPTWYQRSIDIPGSWKSKRVFILFEAASQVARVHVNGEMLGEHRGGFTAFCYELTPYLQYGKRNDLRVEVDNTHRMDLPPLSGDFNVNGGLYRHVWLIVTNKICVTPMHYASPGVFITPLEVGRNKAVIRVCSYISNGNRTAMSNEPEVEDAHITVETVISNAKGDPVAVHSHNVNVRADVTKVDTQKVSIDKPELWQGRDNPYLYTVTVNVWDKGVKIDSVEQPLGIREVAISDERGFLLNNKPYPVYGIGRHQDMKDMAWAMTAAADSADIAVIKDMGATAIRFAHYPQNQAIHSMADREGLLVWDEIPLVNEIRLDEPSRQNVETMLREMICQLYNHPSVAWWGLFNEIENTYTPPSEDFLLHLKHAIRSLDPSSRVIVAASDHGLRAYNKIPDAICFNNYPGWYHGNYPKKECYEGKLSQLSQWIDDRAKEAGKRIGISEYGAGGDPTQHTEGDPVMPHPAHGGKFQPEEWLAWVHEQDWRVMKANSHLWGTFLWSMFDFSSCMRNEGSVPSINTKGIVSHDRKVRKAPFYLYQANWTTKPMVYITSRRSVLRHQAVTDVKVYSNCQLVTLKVNGRTVGKEMPDDIRVTVFKDIRLKAGNNLIEVIGTSSNGASVSDQVVWRLAL